MDPFGWLLWLIIGALVGWLAFVVIDRQNTRSVGLALDVIVGIIGAFIGGFMFEAMSPVVVTFNPWSLFVALVGALVLTGLMYLFVGKPK